MKKNFTFIFILFLSSNIFAKNINELQILPSNHWIYESLYLLQMEQSKNGFNENSMMTVGELKFYFKDIEFEKLSETGKTLYKKVDNFLNNDEKLFEYKAFSLDTSIILNPELYYKSNNDIPWTFKYKYIDNCITMPIKLGFSDYFLIETDIYLGKSNMGASKNDNFTNIPYREDDPEFLFPRFAYGSFGLHFDTWGFNIISAKEGLTIGNTKTGSIFYNNTFETDGYVQANIYTDFFKYSMDVVEVDYTKYLYLHEIECHPFKSFKISFIEGTQINDSLHLRYLNPLMVMHSYSAWNEYDQDPLISPYGEEKYCAYFGFLFDWNPIKNFRIYGLYAQNEIQAFTERNTKMGNLYPDSLGGQLGFEIIYPDNNYGYYKFFTEVVYTSPYLYIKHTPESSLYRVREDNMCHEMISSWIGSPFGPDCIAGNIGFEYQKVNKWKLGLSYLLVCKGENDFGIFEQKSKPSSDQNNRKKDSNYDENKVYYSYYPPVKWNLYQDSYEEDKEKALNMLPSGIIQYKNQISLSGEYNFTDNISINSKISYSFIFNNKNLENNFQQGIELDFAFTYKLF